MSNKITIEEAEAIVESALTKSVYNRNSDCTNLELEDPLYYGLEKMHPRDKQIYKELPERFVHIFAAMSTLIAAIATFTTFAADTNGAEFQLAVTQITEVEKEMAIYSDTKKCIGHSISILLCRLQRTYMKQLA